MEEIVYQAACEVFTELGVGLSECIYGMALFHHLRDHYGLQVDREVIIPVCFKQHQVGALRADLIVRHDSEPKEIIVELKAQNSITDHHIIQLKAYIKHRPNTIGLLLNFTQKDINGRVEKEVLL